MELKSEPSNIIGNNHQLKDKDNQKKNDQIILMIFIIS